MPEGRSSDPSSAGQSSVARHDTTWTRVEGFGDLTEKSARRLGIFGLLSAIAHPTMYFALRAVLPPAVFHTFPFPPAFFYAMWSAVACGLLIFLLAFSRKLSPGSMLDIGLTFEVVGAFLIGLMQTSTYSSAILVQTGMTGVTLWVVFFVLVVPNSFGKTALAALLSALMGPVALVVASYLNRQPLPPPYLFFVVAFPALMGAAIAAILTRFIYNLGRDVSKARELGSYQLVELLGRGGMGEVWRAQHRFLARPAAIKLIQPEVLGCDDSRETETVKRRFEREAQATAMLTSPHTIILYDFGTSEDGIFYYVMELLRGVDLATLVERFGPVPADRTSHFLMQICSSLEEAHRRGLIHRDIKPANIYSCRCGVEYDFVKVLDFGVVKATKESALETQVTSTMTATGTPGFMAPELALGVKDIDGRADLYGVGCVGYWLLTGRLVFEEDTFIATLLAHANKTPVRPSQRTEIPVPAVLEDLIMSCLEKDPDRRPASAGEIIRVLSQSGAASSWTPQRSEKWWTIHMPEKTGHETETAHSPLQANVQAS